MKKKMNETRTLDEVAMEAKEKAPTDLAMEAKEKTPTDLAKVHINTNIHFKAGPLEDATKDLAKYFNGIVNNIKEACKTLYRVESETLWKEGGFKNLGEYAQAIDLNPNLAYKYKDYGAMLEHENETIRSWAESTDYTKAVKVKSEDPKRLEEAIKNGTITADTTVKDIDNWKKEGKERKPDILDKYDINGYILHPFHMPEGESKCWGEEVKAENVLESEYMNRYFHEYQFASVKSGNDRVYLGIGPDGSLATYTRAKHIQPKAKPGKGPNGGPTYAELQAQLAELQAQLASMNK